tara:strand:+ start:37 stop:489 length:453 start_codon:yes stop_codon:yes gene_type:complete
MQELFKYTLTNPISVSKDGEYSEVSEVVVYAPRPRDKYKVLKLEADLNNAFLETFPKIEKLGGSSESSTEKSSNNDLGIGSLVVQFASSESISSIAYNAEQIFLSGTDDKPTITIGGVQMKPDHFKNGLGTVDLKALIGRYSDHFLSLGS